MQFGIQTSQAHATWEQMRDLWAELDRNSLFDSLWVVDHFVTGFGTAFDSAGPHLEGWTLLAGLAMVTSRVRIGVLVTGVTYREPAVLAKMATTVDHISGGRLNFGIGAAWHEFEHRCYGIPFPPVRERMERLEEAVHLIKLLWTSTGPVSWQGKHYRLEDAPYAPQNVQQPHPPIFVGGGGERRTLRIAARYADAMNVFGSPEVVRHKIDVLRRHCEAVGRDPSQIRITVTVPFLPTEDEGRVQRFLMGFGANRGVGPEEARRWVLVGRIGEMAGQVAEYAAAGVQELYLQPFIRLRPEPFLEFSQEVVARLR